MSLSRSLTAEPKPITEASFMRAHIPQPMNDRDSDVR
jgi:hypothetical protein